VTANISKGVPYNVCCEPVCLAERGRYTQNGIEQRYEARQDGKTNVLTTVQKDNNICEPVRVGTWPNNAKNQSHDSQQYRIYSTEGKSVTLCGNGGGMGAKTGLYAIPVEFDGDTPTKAVSCADGNEYTVYEVKDGFITIKGKQYPIKLQDGFYIIRKLTVTECKRLQTVPEWYEFPVSDTQAYKMLGNGWTVDVIAHLVEATKIGLADEEQQEESTSTGKHRRMFLTSMEYDVLPGQIDLFEEMEDYHA
jgi:DNA (cytosine-5)-methyltransferase 3A